MKKRILLITIFLVIGLIIIYIMPLPKQKTWIYKLPNNYVIEKKSETQIILDFKDGNKKVKVNDYIAEFSYGKKYVLLKCLDNKKDNLVIKFYIVDTENNKLYGPYVDYSTFMVIVDEIVDEEIGDWVKTIDYKN